MTSRNMSFITLLVFCSSIAIGSEYKYKDIEKRNGEVSLKKDVVTNARMQGECLVGLKELNFRKKENFDPIAEWTNYRTISLLEQYSPCEVLIMMEVAQKKLRELQ